MSGDITYINEKRLYRIRAIRDFDDVKSGDLGGYVEHEDNLSHRGMSWLYDNSMAFDNATIEDDAKLYDNAVVFENGACCGKSVMRNQSLLFGNACLHQQSELKDFARVYDSCDIAGASIIGGFAECFGSKYYIDYKFLAGATSEQNEKSISYCETQSRYIRNQSIVERVVEDTKIDYEKIHLFSGLCTKGILEVMVPYKTPKRRVGV